MKRTVATQLALVNWRGVFYERYLLDPGVTALEGVNGAGKTTVMIAAYVVLLPDQRYLNFEPLAEAGGGRSDDRGIWGRLGAGDAYSVIDFTLGSRERLIAGVHFERNARDGGELRPFVIDGLPPSVPLQQILLERRDGHDEVPAPDRLAAQVAMAGGRLSWADSVGDYLRRLFDAGVMPMPMSIDSERAKLNELLRTSMLGGISRKLGDGLRTFLLRPDESLGQNLKRIRGNLDDCRRTRLLVSESRQLEGEIHDVLEAGARMFAAAVEGTRRFADERRRQAEAAVAARDAAQATRDALVDRMAEARAGLTRAERDEAQARALAEATAEGARITRRANEIWRQLEAATRRLATLEAAATTLDGDHQRALATLVAREATVREREDDHREAAKGMADIQEGLERLHLRASRHRAVRAALARARSAAPTLEFADQAAPEALARCQAGVEAASRTLADAERRLASAEAQRIAFAEVHAALERVAARTIAPDEAHAAGREALRALRAAEGLVERLPALREARKSAEALADRQASARTRAADLATISAPLDSLAAVREARERVAERADEARAVWKAAIAAQAEAAQARTVAEAEVVRLTQRLERWRRMRAIVDPIAARWTQPMASGADLVALVGWLQAAGIEAEQAVDRLGAEAGALEGQLQALRDAAGAVPADLAEACAAVEGRLLVERFEDVPYAQAAEIEARLGPLAQAILVEDLAAAVETLSQRADRPATIWLLDGPRSPLTPERLPSAKRRGDSVLAPIAEGMRLTRLPAAPVVGRQARERRVEALEAALATVEGALADAQARGRLLAEDRRQIAPWLAHAALLDAAAPDVAAAEARAQAARVALEAAERAVADGRARMERAERRQNALDALWTDAALLDPPDHAARIAALDGEIGDAARAERHLVAVEADREVLEARLDVLNTPPLDAAARSALEDVARAARRSREGWLAPRADLETVCADLEALDFTSAEEILKTHETLLASLNAEVDGAEARLIEARQARDTAKAAESAAEVDARVAKAAHEAGRQTAEALRIQLAEVGVDDPSDAAVEAATRRAASTREAHATARRAVLDAERQVAGLEPRVEVAAAQLAVAEQDLSDKQAQASPAIERWAALEARCAALGLLDAALGDASLEPVATAASIKLFELRQRGWDLTLERLDRATDGADLAAHLRATAGGDAGAEQYLEAWLRIREWLARRVPRHVSEVDDPVDALRRLRRHLDGLVSKLARYEERLQGDSRNVARAVEDRLRRVRTLLGKLNRDLRGVGFGSIEAIRIRSEREPRMQDILDALDNPEGQLSLFQEGKTIEEALDDLFLRHGGRQRGGQRILDYREYLRLRVEVQRRGADAWAEARGNQMSTGEAIGVGAAIMMVVLAAWERDAQLLRARREVGTLRFLFLDEATRLSLDNLEVLFDLCRALDLQLLVAAPEVATSAGNTTYLLQRTTDAEGREVVVVSGRRARAE